MLWETETQSLFKIIYYARSPKTEPKLKKYTLVLQSSYFAEEKYFLQINIPRATSLKTCPVLLYSSQEN